MALAYFSPAYPPTADQYQDTKTPRLLEADFGDGYSQTAPDGPNAFPSILDVSWSNMEPSDADAIEAFFSANVGLAFFWMPPGSTTYRKWICKNYVRGKGATLDNIQCTLNERFDQT